MREVPQIVAKSARPASCVGADALVYPSCLTGYPEWGRNAPRMGMLVPERRPVSPLKPSEVPQPSRNTLNGTVGLLGACMGPSCPAPAPRAPVRCRMLVHIPAKVHDTVQTIRRLPFLTSNTYIYDFESQMPPTPSMNFGPTP